MGAWSSELRFDVSDSYGADDLLDVFALVDYSSRADFGGVGFEVEDSAHKGVRDFLEGTRVDISELLVLVEIGD